jgi:siroheme synthase-like protein
MRYLPVLLDLADRPCVVVGGGPVAAGKAERLLAAGALVTIVASEVSPELRELLERAPGLRLVHRSYREDDLDGAAIAFAATSDPRLQEQIARDAERRRVWLNAVDDPARCSFLMPAILERGPITIAVSTGGASPALARWLRDRLAAWLGPEYTLAADHLAALRRRFAAGRERGEAFSRLLDDGLVQAFRDADSSRVERLTRAACDRLTPVTADIAPDRES